MEALLKHQLPKAFVAVAVQLKKKSIGHERRHPDIRERYTGTEDLGK